MIKQCPFMSKPYPNAFNSDPASFKMIPIRCLEEVCAVWKKGRCGMMPVHFNGYNYPPKIGSSHNGKIGTDNRWTLAEIVKQLDSCNYSCEGGDLNCNVAYRALKLLAKQEI